MPPFIVTLPAVEYIPLPAPVNVPLVIVNVPVLFIAASDDVIVPLPVIVSVQLFVNPAVFAIEHVIFLPSIFNVMFFVFVKHLFPSNALVLSNNTFNVFPAVIPSKPS